MKTTARIASAACLGSLLLACGSVPPVRPSMDWPRGVTAPPFITTPPPAPFGSADGYYAQGRVEHGALHPARARRAYMLALQLDPRHRGARNGLAVLLAEQGQYSRAIAVWRALLTEDKALPAAEQAILLGNVGHALSLRGDKHEAAAALKMACRLDPLQPLAWEHLAAVLESLGQASQALPLRKQARTLREHDLRGDYVLAGTAPAAAGNNPWPADLPRTEIVVTGPAMVEVRRVGAARPPAPASVPPARHTAPRAGMQGTQGDTGWLSAR